MLHVLVFSWRRFVALPTIRRVAVFTLAVLCLLNNVFSWSARFLIGRWRGQKLFRKTARGRRILGFAGTP